MRYVFVALGLTGLLVLGLLRGVTAGFSQLEDDLIRVIGPGRTRVGGTEFHGPPRLKIDSSRTPGSWWQGGATLAFRLTADVALHPRSLELWSATDHDADGHVAGFEWTRLCAVPAAESAGQFVADLPPTHVNATACAYRIVVRYRDREPWSQRWFQQDLTYDDVE